MKSLTALCALALLVSSVSDLEYDDVCVQSDKRQADLKVVAQYSPFQRNPEE